MPVIRFALVRKIGQLKPEFLEKSSNVRLMCILRFLATNNLVHRVATHTAQRPLDEVHEDAKSHLVLAVPVIGHGIGGKYIPIMARLAEARRWSKR